MKKILLALSLVTLLAGCTETVVDSTSGDPTSEKVFAPTPFYIVDLDADGFNFKLTADPVEFLSESEGTCRNSADIYVEDAPPLCNPNGFLIVNIDTSDTVQYTISSETPVYINNVLYTFHTETKSLNGADTITFEALRTAFEEGPDFFAVTPFELEYGTVMVDGQEMTDQITALKEIYIP